ncbi:MAG: glycosyltransferase family 4 protein [Burkholderiaceae bacterium]|jgi:GalNAc-alpha-(1->4)-GalNAc-alpha-(1->3)-diNAcBac-PP-undecaprenol alpha-1,4-N-acetyl-D-galactosaminyltransferase
MRIMFFVSSMNAGGAERVAATLANAWVARGDVVTLVPTYSGRGTCFYPLHPDVRLVWLADCLAGGLGKAARPVAKLLEIRALVRRSRPDVIVSFLSNVNVMVLAATRGLGVPVLVSERTNPAFSDEVGFFLAGLRRLSYGWASTVVMQSHDAVRAFRPMVPRVQHMVAIPNPLPPQLQGESPWVHEGNHPAPQAEPSPAGRLRLVAMGRLVHSKRFGPLIDIFARLAPAHPEWDLHIWGDGPLREALREKISALNLAGRVVLEGRTSTPWEHLAQADIFVMTSEVEGFPNVLLEAMALGRACVTVDCPSGPRDMTDGGRAGRLVPLGDESALVDALAALMNDSGERMRLGRLAAGFVRERYGLPAVLALWDQAFAQAGVHTVGVAGHA